MIKDSVLYGATTERGARGNDILYQMNTDESGFTVLNAFSEVLPTPSGDLGSVGNSVYGTDQGCFTVDQGAVYTYPSSLRAIVFHSLGAGDVGCAGQIDAN
jgi:hypothetical protein